MVDAKLMNAASLIPLSMAMQEAQELHKKSISKQNAEMSNFRVFLVEDIPRLFKIPGVVREFAPHEGTKIAGTAIGLRLSWQGPRQRLKLSILVPGVIWGSQPIVRKSEAMKLR